jgi:hypothetical protein
MAFGNMTAEEITQLNNHISRMVAEGIASERQGQGGHQGARVGAVKQNYVNPSHTKMLESFDGEDKNWKEWRNKFLAVIKCSNQVLARMVMKVEGSGMMKSEKMNIEDIQYEFEQVDDMYLGTQITVPSDFAEECGQELYVNLLMKTKGRANHVVSQTGIQNGFVAWKRLCEEYEPRTPARAMHVITDVLNPKVSKDPRQQLRIMEELDQKLKILEVDFGEKLSDFIKCAILTRVVPKDVNDLTQVMVKDNWNYHEVREQSRAVLSSRASQANPKGRDDMDVDEVTYREGSSWGGTGRLRGRGDDERGCHIRPMS